MCSLVGVNLNKSELFFCVGGKLLGVLARVGFTVRPSGSLNGGQTMWKRGMATWKTSSLFAGGQSDNMLVSVSRGRRVASCLEWWGNNGF